MRNVTKTLLLALALTMAMATNAFAGDNGQGWYGDIDDKIVTFFGLGLVILFPLIAWIFSVIYERMQRHQEERKEAIFKHK